MRPLEQIYSNYTSEDFKVWELLYKRQTDFIENKVAVEFLESLETVGFTSDRIPNFKEVNNTLSKYTGWQIITVPNLAPANVFFNHLSEKRFTATCWLRALDQIDYLEEPDMFHDVFAHTPLLSNKEYTDFFQKIGQRALQVIHEPEKVTMLQRLYWFTIEFGLIRSSEETKIYGAGIISSKGEAEYSLSNESTKLDYDVTKIMNHPYRTDIIQDTYYVIDSFEQLTKSFDQIDNHLFN
jgi:phenylalanine-4-hydroxylase